MSSTSVKSSATPRVFSALSKIAACLVLLLSLPSAWAAGSTTVVISQIYTAGGNAGATYNADYVELFNVSSSVQSLNGFALQYASAAGTTGTVIALPPGVTLQPGQRYLIQGTASATVGAALPNPADVTLSGLAMGAAAGKIYLTKNQTALADVCTDPSIVDFVGYGTTASCFEGSKYAPAPSATLADVRSTPCTDTNDNSVDFAAVTVSTANPRNSLSAVTPCGGGSSGISVTPTANPTSVYQNAPTLLTATVAPGSNPASTGITVSANLSAFGGSTTQPFYDDGSNGDATANDGIYSYKLAVTTAAPLGSNTIVVTAKDGQSRTGSANLTLTVLAPLTLIPIHTIQGNQTTNPGASTYAGQTVMTSGIVTGIRTNGFYMQAKDSDADADVNTPEGIFVHYGTGSVPKEAVIGNNLQLTGVVSLYPSGVSRPGTEIDSTAVPTILTTGNALPTPITLTGLPTPNPSPTGGVNQLMRYQSMRVVVPSFTVTGPTAGILDEPNETYTSNGQFWGTVTGMPRPAREPGLEVLDPFSVKEMALMPAIPHFDDNPELFEVDSIAMLPTPGPLDLASGTVLTNLSGVMDFTGGPSINGAAPTSGPLLVIDATTRPTVTGGMVVTPVSAALPGELTIGDQNVERFYDVAKETGGATAVTQTAYNLRLAKLSLEVRNVMRMPDILAVEEVENLPTLTDIANKISADAIAASQTDPHYVPELVIGNDGTGISSGFLINPAKVTIIKVEQFGKDTTFTQPSTGNQAELNDRPPYVLHAGIKRTGTTDYPLTVIVNHLKSLDNANADSGTGQNTRAKREKQAEYLATLVQGYQTAGEHVIVVGDLNTFEFNDGLVDSFGILSGKPQDPTQDVVPGPATPLVSPALVDKAPTDVPNGVYSYVYLGNAQSIDHFLTTADIASIVRTVPVHINADFPDVLRNDATRPEGGSDHDGIVGYLKVPGTTAVTLNPTSLTFATQNLNTTTTQTVTVTNTGTTPITVTSIVATGSFSVVASPCGASIVAGTPCVITVSFKPTVTGPVTGTLTLTDSDVSGTQTVALSGTGAGIFSQTALTLSSANIVFGANSTFTATVTGNAGVTPTGTVNFLDGATVLKTGAALNASGVATFTTTTPLAVGSHPITAVYSGDTAGPYPTSTSAASTVVVAAPPVPDFTFTVANGQIVFPKNLPSSNTTVSVAMTNGFSSTVSFACSGLPASSRCSFSPATLSATGTSTLTVTINTTSAALRSPFEGMHAAEGVMACGLLALPFFLRRKTRTALRKAASVMMLLLLAGGLAAISGCSGGGTASLTPAGTSTVTVTATGGSVSHTATFAVVVQ